MKMRRSTRTTSTSGVMLISASAVWVCPFEEKAMARGPPSHLFRMLRRRGWGDHGCVFDGVEELAAEVVQAGCELAQTGGELVISDNRRDSDDEAGGGGDEGLRDAGGDGEEGCCAGGDEAVEGVDDTHDGAEEADERRDGGDGGEPGHATLDRGERFTGGCLGGAFERGRIAGHAASAILPLVLVVDLAEDGDERAGLELLGDSGDFAEPCRFAEGAKEAQALGVGPAE